MAELRGTRRVARPVAAGVVGAIGIGPAIRLRTCEHVVRVWRVTAAVDYVSFFSQSRQFDEIVAEAREFGGVSVQISEAVGDFFALSVVPRAGADAIAGVDSGLAICGAEFPEVVGKIIDVQKTDPAFVNFLVFTSASADEMQVANSTPSTGMPVSERIRGFTTTT